MHIQNVSRPRSNLNCRIASRKGRDSISPTVPPISTMATSAPLAFSRIFDLISSVMWNYLHGTAEIVAAAFLLDNGKVNLTGGEIAFLGKFGVVYRS
jgi:hypothetical protein